MRSNYSLLPITFAAVFGIGIGVFTMVRTLARSPDVILDRKHNPRPYEKLEHKQYRFFMQPLEQDDPDKPTLFENEKTD